MTSKTKPTDPYAKAGVNIEKGNELVESIKASVNATHDRRVLGGIGGFAGLFQLGSKYKNPVLVGCTDGVGTKVALSQAYNKTHLTGQDLVAMCVNDMVTCGAKPLFFLDYFAASKLEPKVTAKIVKGIANACKKSNCALLGGETAEMPGHYAKDNFDLAGFSVGVVEKTSLIDGKGIKPGHVLLGIESSGPHSNGYSLIRSILKKHKPSEPIMRVLLKPTHLYPAPVLELIKKTNVKGMAHITGGGLTENIPRILNNGLIAEINLSSWKFPKAFQWLQEKGKISQSDMLRIFNCGIGMVCILDKADVLKAKKVLSKHKLRTYEIGSIIKGDLKEQIQYQ
ncbi:MAG: phosphoribosylformylglycinamidine cyclo-ligase [Gammaproteobacteria bacterium]|jgi:phosphoribosylformylglycinamidine cyclo-ligase